MLQRIIHKLKTTSFYETIRRLRMIYGVMDRRGKQMVVILQINKVLSALIGTFGVACIALFLILLAKPDILTENRYMRTIYEALGVGDVYFLVFLSGFVVLGAIVHQLFVVFSSFMEIRLTEGMVRRCTVMLYRYYLVDRYESHIRRGTSGVIAKSLMGNRTVVSREVHKAAQFLASLVNVVSIFGGLFFVNTQAAAILVFFLVSSYVIFFVVHKKQARLSGQKIFRQQMAQVRLVREGGGAATEIRLMGKEREFTQQVEDSLAGVARERLKQQMRTGLPQRTIFIASVCALYIIVVFTLVNDSQQKAFTSLAFFAAGLFRLLPAMQSIFIMFIEQVIDTAQFGSVMKDLQLAKKHLDEDKSDGETFQLVQVKDNITFDNVSYTYPEADKQAIRNLSFSLPANKIIALFGRSGVGKTTVIRLLSGLLFPQEGRVLVDGRALRDDDQAFMRNWQKSSGFVLQKPFFMKTTLAMNIAFEATEDQVDYKRVREVVKLAQLEDFIASLPKGLDTDVAEDAEILSGGQRQRLAIARALYRDSSVLVLDEATNALDLVVEKKIISSLINIGKNKIIIIIAHRPDTMRFADMVLVMKEDGSIAQGSYDELVARDADFRALAGTVEQAAS